MNDINKSINYQFKKYKEEILEENFEKAKKFNKVKKYKYIFAINYFVSRPELSKYWNNYFKWSLSFLYEAYYSFSLGRTDSGVLLLRSSIDNFVKFIIKSIGKEDQIGETVFKPNNHILVTYEWKENQLNLTNKSRIFQEEYNNFSRLSHSAINSSATPISFFSQLNKDFKANYEYGMKSFKRIAKIYIYFIVYVCQDSLKKWDTVDLEETLSIMMLTKEERNKIYNFIKNK